MAAKNVLLGGKKKAEDNGIGDKVTGAYKRWYDRLTAAVRMAMPPTSPYTVIHTENLVGLFTCIFVKNGERAGLGDVAVKTIKRGMGGRYGNKVRIHSVSFVCWAGLTDVYWIILGWDCREICDWRLVYMHH